MLAQWIRLILDDNGTQTDYSLAGQNADTIPFALVSAEDYFYIGQHYPFNNVYFKLSTANTNTAVPEIEVWDGDSFLSAVDVLDETAVSGTSLSRSGVVQFSPQIDETWEMVWDPEDEDGFPLSTSDIYNLYWARFKWSADLSAGTVIDKVGYRFATSASLVSIDPEINQYLESWSSGKIDWDDEIQVNSDLVVGDMKARGLIVSRGQILRFDTVAQATSFRTLFHIYSILGAGFEDKQKWAMGEYEKLMSSRTFTTDRFINGREDRGEVEKLHKRLIR